jgi:hypothetical protein
MKLFITLLKNVNKSQTSASSLPLTLLLFVLMLLLFILLMCFYMDIGNVFIIVTIIMCGHSISRHIVDNEHLVLKTFDNHRR